MAKAAPHEAAANGGRLLGKLGLGTVQFGMTYGSVCPVPPPPLCEIREIVALARASGMSLLDTAHAYGEAETILGRILGSDDSFRIVTKTAPIGRAPIGNAEIAAVAAAFEQSLQRLGRTAVHGLLVHHAGDLLAEGGERLWNWLETVKQGRLAGKIGVSVYRPDQLDAVLCRFRPDLVQLPFNIYDQRFMASGRLERLRAAGVEVHARSILLQGLLLQPPEALKRGRFAGLREHHARLHEWLAQEWGMTPLAGALAFVLPDPRVDAAIVGCQSLRQADEIFRAARSAHSIGGAERFAVEAAELIDPSRWG